MTLREMLAFGELPAGQDFLEVTVGLGPVSNTHPPSLKNPTKVHVPVEQDGWRPGDSKKARAAAKARLAEIFELGRRQIGIPQGATTAQLPVFPRITDWI